MSFFNLIISGKKQDKIVAELRIKFDDIDATREALEPVFYRTQLIDIVFDAIVDYVYGEGTVSDTNNYNKAFELLLDKKDQISKKKFEKLQNELDEKFPNRRIHTYPDISELAAAIVDKNLDLSKV